MSNQFKVGDKVVLVDGSNLPKDAEKYLYKTYEVVEILPFVPNGETLRVKTENGDTKKWYSYRFISEALNNSPLYQALR
jgi:hypothetical protein